MKFLKFYQYLCEADVYEVDEVLIMQYMTSVVNAANEHIAESIVKQYRNTAGEPADYLRALLPGFEKLMRMAIAYTKLNNKKPQTEWFNKKKEELFR